MSIGGFALVIGIGVDLVYVPRLRDALQRRPKIAERMFTAREIAECGHGPERFLHLAGRFAAKEAMAKALGSGLATGALADLEIRRQDIGRPQLVAQGGWLSTMQQLGVTRVHVSLSHQGDYAMAQVLVES